MENRVPNYDEKLDQKILNRDFCNFWKCSGLKVEYKCFACPILTDLKNMARELHMESIDWDKKAA